MSQRDLAQMTGISHRMIAHYETHTVIPSIDKLEIIAYALGVSVAKLIDPNMTDKEVLKMNTRILKRVKLIEKLPPEDQKKVDTYIKDLLEKQK